MFTPSLLKMYRLADDDDVDVFEESGFLDFSYFFSVSFCQQAKLMLLSDREKKIKYRGKKNAGRFSPTHNRPMT